jgi:hypothetical protein
MLQLNKVTASYDDDGSILLLINDTKNTGIVHINRPSRTYSMLSRLLDSNGDKQPKLELPATRRLESLNDYRPLHWDATHVDIGENRDGNVVLDLHHDPNTFVAGCAGAGKSALLRNVVANGLQDDTVSLHIIERNYEYKTTNGIIRDHDEHVMDDDLIGMLTMIKKIYAIMMSRYDAIKGTGYDYQEYLDANTDGIVQGQYDYLIIDGAELLFKDDDNDKKIRREITDTLAMICRLSGDVGIFVFMSSSIIPSREILDTMSNRINMGFLCDSDVIKLFNEHSKFDISSNPRGQGIILTNNGEQVPFQARYISSQLDN